MTLFPVHDAKDEAQEAGTATHCDVHGRDPRVRSGHDLREQV